MVTMDSKRKLRICCEGNLNRGDGQQECEPVPNFTNFTIKISGALLRIRWIGWFAAMFLSVFGWFVYIRKDDASRP